ncbi:hypothetical protein J3Q64DRAFT_1646482, partial [Phycomyces blakesleeanus]
LFSFGGTDGDHLYNDIWSYDFQTRLWIQVSAAGYIPVPREGCSACLVDDVMYVIGGRGPEGQDLGDLCAFKIKSQRWFMFQNMGPAPAPRHGLTMTAVREKMYVFGGESVAGKLDDAVMGFVLDSAKIRYPPETAVQAPPAPSLSSTSSSHSLVDSEFAPSSMSVHSNTQTQSPTCNVTPPQPNPSVSHSNSLRSPPLQPQHQSKQSSPISIQASLPRELDSPIYSEIQSSPTRPPRHVSTVPEAALRRPRATSPMPQIDGDMNSEFRRHPAPPLSPTFSTESSETLDVVKSAENNEERVNLLREIKSRDQVIQDMKKKEQWWRTEVSLARKQRAIEGEMSDDLQYDKRIVFEQLVAVKAELRRVRTSIGQQAQPMSDKLTQADRIRTAALQEAAYFKSKYLALKSRQEDELATLETERAALLERRLTTTLKENESNGKLLQQLQRRAQHDHGARLSAEERAKEAHERAEEAQEAHQRALEELSMWHGRATRAEAQMRENTAKMADLTQQLTEALSLQAGQSSASQNLSEVHIKVSQLEAANLKARNEAATLKQRLAESLDDIARLRTLLNEREESLLEATRHLEDSEIQLGMMKEAMSQKFTTTRAY